MKRIKPFLREKIRRSIGPLAIMLYKRWPSRWALAVVNQSNYIQLSSKQMELMISAIKKNNPCNFLVFGLGCDSMLWQEVNDSGKTIFIEDNQSWLQKITGEGVSKAHLVDYATKRNEWEKLLESPNLLEMSLPSDIENEKWDVILVDAPAGYSDTTPGRMKSIFMAKKLIKENGDIFVHDSQRKVEAIYCDYFLKEENFKEEIRAKLGSLRHYKIPKTDNFKEVA